jgi:hypothetical protein
MVRMLAIISAFVQQILLTGQFKVSTLPSKTYQELLTAVEQPVKEPVVLINSLVELVKRLFGRLIVDDTSNSKYARLRGLSRKLFIPSTGGFSNGD